MKTLPKRCLLHNAVILLVYLCFRVLSKHSTSLPNYSFIVYNGLILTLSAAYMYCDFNTNVFKLRFKIVNIFKQVILGLGFAFLLSLFFVCIAMMLEDISLFPQLQDPLDIQDIIFLVLLQIVVALAEEAFFNYYLYDTLMLLLRGNVVLSIIVTASLFSWGHWVSNGIVKQVVIAFVFRLTALLIRKRFHEDNAFYICSSMHFFYNLMSFFVFSI